MNADETSPGPAPVVQLSDGTVTLRTPTTKDAPTMAKLVQTSMAHISPWMVWATPDYDEAASLAWINREDDATSHPFVVCRPSGEPVGSAGLNKVDAVNRVANLGYWLAPTATGEGFATRATNLLIGYGIDQVGLHRLEVWMSTENEASQAVAERSLATYEGTLRQCLRYGDRQHDAHCYGFVAPDTAVSASGAT